MTMTKTDHWDAWYEATQIIQNAPLDTNYESDGLFSPAQAGTVTLAASYAVAGALLYTKHPAAMAAAGIILAVPDPVIFGLGSLLA